MYLLKEQLEDKWWHRLAKVLIIFATTASFTFAIVRFVDKFRESPLFFFLSFENGYSEIKAKEQKLKDVSLSLNLEDKIINRIKDKNPPILSKNSFPVGPWGPHGIGTEGAEPERKKLYPKEFIETQCSVGLFSGLDCFEKIVENYPDWKIKSWRSIDYSVFLVFLIVPQRLY